MLVKGLFRKPKNALEATGVAVVPDEPGESCPKCKKNVFCSELIKNCHVCPFCGHHFRINARQRLSLIADEGTFSEHDSQLVSDNLIDFPGYDEKLKNAGLSSAEKESVICGVAEIGGHKCALFAMEPNFMMGSMGRVTGEKITRLFEFALTERLPVIGFCVSGGARMQEGIISLMQMAKTSGAVGRHGDAGLLYISVLTDPTTGGVMASFAMEGDIIIAEPGALIGFAGPRVIEQTIRQKLPQGFQSAEFLLEKGFVDIIVPRQRLKESLKNLLSMHEEAVVQ